MYVCICRAVTDHAIRNAVADGTLTVGGLRKRLGCTGQCGKCKPQVREIRDAALAEQYARSLPAVSCT